MDFFFVFKHCRIISFIIIGIATVTVSADDFEDTITFTVFKEDGNHTILPYNSNLTDFGCNSNDKLAIIVHGWTESLYTDWVPDLINNLLTFRGGCVIFMDYSNHSIVVNYFNLVKKFNPITNVLLTKLEQFVEQSFDENQIFLYGFSFGAQVVIQAGILFGEKRIAEIDVCDPAGPGFALSSELVPTLAAKNVQCIHTSGNRGTLKRNCHQDWLMGRCGRMQDAASLPPRGSHGLCPKFYNAAFTHDFLATENIYQCSSRRIAVNVPEGFKMGYMEKRKDKVFGDLFSATSVCYPYNNYELLMSAEYNNVGRLGRRRRRMQRLSMSRKLGENCDEIK